MNFLVHINNRRFVLISGIITYIIMFILAVLYYKERVIMCDAAFQLFSILKEDGFAIQINRYGAAFTQVFPLLASKLHLPLSSVALAYSLSFLIFYTTVFLIVLLVLKNEKMALVILLFNTLMVRHSFFWIQCEFVQGAVFTLLYLALVEHVLRKDRVPLWFYILSPFFLVTIVYFYPLLLFIMLFGTAFFMLIYRKKIKFLAVIIAAYLAFFVIKISFLNNFYDAQSMSGLKNILNEFPGYFQLTSFKNFYRYVVNDYYLLFIFLIVTAVYLLYNKKYLQLLLMSSFLFGICFLINVNFAQGVDQFYLESQYLILVVFVGMPFAWFVMQEKRLTMVCALLLVFSITLSLIRITVTREMYSKRVVYIRELNAQSTAKRIMPKEKVNAEVLRFIWGISFEALLLSNIENGRSASIVYEESPDQFNYLMSDTRTFVTQMGIYEYKDLNDRYFVKDTLTGYIKY